MFDITQKKIARNVVRVQVQEHVCVLFGYRDFYRSFINEVSSRKIIKIMLKRKQIIAGMDYTAYEQQVYTCVLLIDIQHKPHVASYFNCIDTIEVRPGKFAQVLFF